MHLFSGVCLCSLCIIQSAQCLRERQKDGPPCFVLLPFLRCVCDIERDTPEEVKKKKNWEANSSTGIEVTYIHTNLGVTDL